MQTPPLGPFLLERPVGRGGMGVVWRARHLETGLKVAIKVLTAERARDPRFGRAFRHEVRAMATLDHPAIVDIYDHGVVPAHPGLDGVLPPGSPYLVMEWAAAGTLEDRTPPAHWAEVRALLVTLLDALAHAHARGVLHRDLKPANVLATAEGDVRRAAWRLSDFGIARIGASEGGEADGGAGTPAYMAPEQIRGAWREQGPWTDLYALGCMAWELLTGAPPYLGRAQEVLVGHLNGLLPGFEPRMPVPPGIDMWLQGLLRSDVRGRFALAADARDFLQDHGAAGEQDLPNDDAVTPPSGPGRDSLSEWLVPDDPAEEPPRDWQPRRMPAAEMPDGWRRGVDARGETAASGRPLSAVLPDAGLGLVGLRGVPMVDRENERNRLWNALAAVRGTRRALAMVLGGAAGCGKSRLAEWLCRRAHATGSAWPLRVRADAGVVSGQALAEAIAVQLGCQELPAAEIAARLTWWMGAALAPAEASRLAGVLAGDAPAELVPGERRALLRRPLEWLAAERPVVVWFDDVHADPDAIAFTLDLLKLQPHEPSRVLVLLTATAESLAENPTAAAALAGLLERPEALRLEVGPLAPAHRSELVQGILGLAPELAAQVEERTGGNAQFAVHLVRSWAEQGWLVPGSLGHRLSEDAAGGLPADLGAAWSGRVERLLAAVEPAEAHALELAATLGLEVDAKEWERACRLAGLPIAWRVVERFEEARLVATGGGALPGFRFVHGMLRESLLARAARGDRLSTWHRLCAKGLYDRPMAEVAERLGRHLLGAGDREAALQPLLSAADQRLRRADRGGALALLADRERAMEALTLKPGDRRWGVGWALRAELLRTTGAPEDAEILASRGLSDARRHRWGSLEGAFLCQLAHAARRHGRVRDALPLLEEAVLREEACDDTVGLVTALRNLAGSLHRVGDLDRAEFMAGRALVASEALGDPSSIASCLRTLGTIHTWGGRMEPARARLDEALALARTHAFTALLGPILNDLGNLERHTGAGALAVERYRDAAQAYRRAGDPEVIVAEINLATVLAEVGRYADATRQLADCAHDPQVTRQPYLQAAVHMIGALTSAGTGDWDGFESDFERACDILSDTGERDPDFATLAWRAGVFARAAGKVAHADAALRFAAEVFRDLGRATEAEACRRGEGPG